MLKLSLDLGCRSLEPGSITGGQVRGSGFVECEIYAVLLWDARLIR